MSLVQCSNCFNPYPDTGVPYLCPICGGIFDIPNLEPYDVASITHQNPGIWRYRHTFGNENDYPVISLGEGNTSLIWTKFNNKSVALKYEHLNPTGSFKDRGSAVLSSFLLSRGVTTALEDSSGNAGASLAAYAALAGISVKIFVPDSASGVKQKQIEIYGAEIIRIPGPRSNAADAVQQAISNEHIYASHAYLPFNLPGYATLAYELVEQLDGTPGTVILPVGQGGLFIGLAMGFENLVRVGVITKVPKLVGVQALACAPLWALYKYGTSGLRLIGENKSIAEGIMVRFPVRGDRILKICDIHESEFIAVEESEIIRGINELAKRGFLVEPTSAVVWGALEHGILRWPEPIVIVLTGNGLKNLN